MLEERKSVSFTVVGTDMNGNAQTEVITGPAASASVIGLKTLKQFLRLHQIVIRQVQLH